MKPIYCFLPLALACGIHPAHALTVANGAFSGYQIGAISTVSSGTYNLGTGTSSISVGSNHGIASTSDPYQGKANNLSILNGGTITDGDIFSLSSNVFSVSSGTLGTPLTLSVDSYTFAFTNEIVTTQANGQIAVGFVGSLTHDSDGLLATPSPFYFNANFSESSPTGAIAATYSLASSTEAGVYVSPNDIGYVVGTRDAPSGSTPTEIALKGLNIQPGASYTLGVYETLNLDNGHGTLNVSKGAVFTGNGIIDGNVLNKGLVRIPVTWLSQVSGGHAYVPVPDPIPGPGGPTIPPIVSPNPVPIPGNTIVTIGGSSGGGGGSGGSSGGSGGGSTGYVYTIDTPLIPSQGTHAIPVDASLEVTGSYAQTDTGALRLFVDGNQGADLNVSRTSGSYSQLFVDKTVTLAGTVQIVLEPGKFTSFGYTPKIGDTFDFVTGLQGITLANVNYELFVTDADKSLLSWLTLTQYDSGILSDPDSLWMISERLFRFDLVEGNTILRGTLIASLLGPTSQVPTPGTLWLVGAGLMGFAGAGRRRKASAL